MTSRLDQLFLWGNFHEALEASFVSTTDLLHYLINKCQNRDQDPTESMLIAYRALCNTSDWAAQDNLIDQQHFLMLIDRPEFSAIYIVSGGPVDILESRYPKIYLGWFQMVLNPTFDHRIRVICSQPLTEPLTIDSAETIIASRNGLLLPVLKICMLRTDYLKYLISTDWTRELKLCSAIDLYRPVVERIKLLQEVAPDYWSQVVHKGYQDLIQSKFNQPVQGLKMDDLQLLYQLVNVVIPPSLQISKLEYAVKSLCPILQQYYLNVDITQVQLTPSQLDQRLSLLQDPSSLLTNNTLTSVANDTDTLLEPINSYLTFDVVSYQQEGKTFYFTRPEFDHLLKSQTNPWNKQPLTLPFLYLIYAKLQIAKFYRLPDAKPALMMINDLAASV